MVEQGHTPDNKNTFASKHFRSGTTGIADDPDKSVRSRMDLENEGLFLRHLGASSKRELRSLDGTRRPGAGTYCESWRC
jgi:hypothetical protein